jgi:hypothetical protein
MSRVRMLKNASNFVLGSKKSRPPHHLGGAHKRGATYSSHRAPSTYRWERAGLGRLRVGRVRYRYASGFFFACGRVGGHF